MTDPRPAPWFTTTPEQVIRAESLLLAMAENRIDDIGAILEQDFADDADPQSPVHMLVALISMAERITDFASRVSVYTPAEIIRETTRIVSTAVYMTQENT